MTTPTPGQPLSEADVSLLPCPLCGHSAKVKRTSGVHGVACKSRWMRETVSCGKCGLSITGKRPNEAKRRWNRRPHAPVSRPGDGVEGERDMSGETFAGFRVAAWRYRQAGETDKLPHHYAEHWSTPGASAWGIQRLFTEDQLLAALTPPAEPVSRPAGEGAWDRVRVEIEKAFAEGVTPDEILSLFRPQLPAGEGERPETDMEHIARDMRDGVFPSRSERKMVPDRPAEWWINRAKSEPDTIISAGLPAGEGEREAVARAIDPEAWAENLPVPTRADVIEFHARRQASIVVADRVLSLLSPAAPDAGGGDDRMQIAVEALKRIAAATPRSTNSAGAYQMASWTAAVANTALSALQPGGER